MSAHSDGTAPAIEVRQLRKVYPGGVEAVAGIDFEVAAGEVFGRLGPNGAGKSTTIGMLTTTVTPTSGHASVAGSATLARRRFALSAHTPREILVPLLTPILFADVIAPALAKSVGSTGGIDYLSYVAVGTIGLLVPLSCALGGIGMIVDRESGAQCDLPAAPVPRGLMVLGNMSAAMVISAFQVIALLAAAVARGGTFSTTASGIAWAAVATSASRWPCTGWLKYWQPASPSRRNMSAPPRRWLSCHGSSPGASFASRQCQSA